MATKGKGSVRKQLEDLGKMGRNLVVLIEFEENNSDRSELLLAWLKQKYDAIRKEIADLWIGKNKAGTEV